MEEEHSEIKRNERERCLESQLLESQTRMVRIVKNMSIYTKFGGNRPIVSIDGYDETVHDGPFRLSRGRRIVMDGHDLIERKAL